MPTVKTVEVNFTFVYVDKRRKYTSKDFGLKSIPYGERAMKPKQTDFQHIKRNSHTSKTFYVELLKSSALTKIAPALPRCL